jgi:hypothetical protein
MECQKSKKACTGGGRIEKLTKKRAAPASPEKKRKRAQLEMESDSEEEADLHAEVMRELREIRVFQQAQAKELQKLRREVKALRDAMEDAEAGHDEDMEWIQRIVAHIFCFVAHTEDGEQNWEGGLLDVSEGESEGSEGSEVDMEEAAREVALEVVELRAEEA